ncbi:MAG TPA: hypothetical protein VHE58_02935 [Burkholderiales bacterium]|nr:hypothetical protein [Burkholderiales bacterium]
MVVIVILGILAAVVLVQSQFRTTSCRVRMGI